MTNGERRPRSAEGSGHGIGPRRAASIGRGPPGGADAAAAIVRVTGTMPGLVAHRTRHPGRPKAVAGAGR